MTVVRRRTLAGAAVLVALAVSCTTPAEDAPPGACATTAAPNPPCAAGLVGYSCSGSSRPDEDPQSIDGVPSGLICTDEGPAPGTANEAYCCTSAPTPCAYDPVSGCAAPTYGYQCRGADRPEAFDSALFCGEGLVEGDLIVYCCGASKPTPSCSQVSGHACPTTLTGWTCHDTSLPSEAELGDNQSRADFNLLVCSIPTIVTGSGGTTWGYCCFTPTSLPAGGSCLEDTTVAGCPPDSFGFACTGVDTPAEDFAGLTCAGTGTSGTSPQGYPATLYCCDYQSPDGG